MPRKLLKFKRFLPLAATLLSTTALTAMAQDSADLVKIGETTALVAEASTPDDGFEIVDGSLRISTSRF